MILGIHTPESEGEKNIEAVKEKARAENFDFPIVVDNERQNWTTWGNGMWPSVYLIDKQGYLRYWWYGELNWQGNDGESIMRRHIEELLSES
jgi:peroxiredoxin